MTAKGAKKKTYVVIYFFKISLIHSVSFSSFLSILTSDISRFSIQPQNIPPTVLFWFIYPKTLRVRGS